MAFNSLCSVLPITCNVKSNHILLIAHKFLFQVKYSLRCFQNSSSLNQAILTPQEVNAILRANEFSHDFKVPSAVKSYDSNQLPSNNPMEDARAEAKCLTTNKVMLGIFDGHAGAACAQVVAKRLLSYICAALLPTNELLNHLESNRSEELVLLERYNDRYEFVQELRETYAGHLRDYSEELSEGGGGGVVAAFKRLDNDLSREAQAGGKPLTVALSGCVACVVVVDGPLVTVASLGDCQAVLGSLTDSRSWQATKLSVEHNSDNRAEVERLLSEHPPSEANSVISSERLLGQLAPLRAFGDFRYKWSRELLEELVVSRFGADVIPPHYHTPPYLSSSPDIITHRLSPRDKFLVIASDGLWDLLSPLQAVRLVGEYMCGRVALTPLRLPRAHMKLGEVSEVLSARLHGGATVPVDSSAATHLLRHALGGSDMGVDYSRISHLLSIPQDIVRLFRDDITVTVVYFDSDYIRTCPI